MVSETFISGWFKPGTLMSRNAGAVPWNGKKLTTAAKYGEIFRVMTASQSPYPPLCNV